MNTLSLKPLVPASVLPAATPTSVLENLAASAIQGGKPGQAADTQLRAAIDSLTSATGTTSATQLELAAALAENTAAVNESAKSGLASAAASAGKSALSNILSMSPLASLITSFTDLFSSAGTQAPVPEPFTLPLTITQHDAVSGGRVVPSDSSADGTPRDATPTPPAGASTTNNFNLTVTALDSQSILDHSDAIASAVQQAMLSNHSILDTIADV
jgi:hypothetical protein